MDNNQRPGNEANLGPRVLLDQPTKDDAFDTHGPLADAIAEVIEEEPGGKSIALEGGWGSGKSSIIEMLKERFTSGAKTEEAVHVFIFDAWSHAGDSLRRAFLEKMTMFCAGEFPGTKQAEIWDEKKKLITGRTRNTDVQSTPIIKSPASLLTVALATVFPVFIVAISPFLRKVFQTWPDTHPFIIVGLTVVLVSAFIPASLLIALALWLYFGKDKKRFEKAGRWIALWGKKVDETATTTTHEGLGPTTIEFQDYFSDLMGCYLLGENRKLVIVLDNLDRVNPDTAQELWITLRIFAEACEQPHNTNWAKRVFMLVPYDPSAAERLWDESSPKGEATTASSENDEDDEDDSVNAKRHRPTLPRLSSAFLDKTFQIRFDVPPLLLADWKAFLRSKLVEAIASLGDQDETLHRIYQLSQYMAHVKGRPPTPRHLTLFVNDIGALYRRFGNHFPVDHLAAYAILRRQGHDVRFWLLESGRDRARFNSIFEGTDYVDSLCSMAHGLTDPAKAKQVLLTPPIQAALAEGNSDLLKEYSSLHGFWEVLESICALPSTAFGHDETVVQNTISACEQAGLFSSYRVELTSLRRFLGRLMADASWTTLTEGKGGNFAAAVRMGLDLSDIKQGFGKVSLVGKNEDPKAPLDASEWVGGIRAFATELDVQQKAGEFKAIAKVPAAVHANEIYAAVAVLKDKEVSQVSRLIGVTGTPVTHAKALLPEDGEDLSVDQADTLVGLLVSARIRQGTSAFIDEVFANFSENVTFNTDEISSYLRLLRRLEVHMPNLVQPKLKAFAKSPQIFQRIQDFASTIDSHDGATLVRWAIESYDFGKAPSSPPDAVSGFKLVTDFGETPSAHSALAEVLVDRCRTDSGGTLLDGLLCESEYLKEFTCDTLRQLRESDGLAKHISPGRYASRFTNLKSLCESQALPNLDQVTDELLGDTQFTAQLPLLNVDGENLTSTIHLVKQGATVKSAEYARNVRELIGNITKDEWVQEFVDDGEKLGLLTAYKGKHADFVLAEHLPAALEEFLSDITKGKHSGVSVPSLWPSVVASVPDNRPGTIGRNIIIVADDLNTDLTPVLQFFGDSLVEPVKEYDRTDSLVRIVFSKLIKSQNPDAIRWVANVTSPSTPHWQKTKEDDRESFRQELEAIFKGTDTNDELRKAVEQVADVLELELSGGDDQSSNDSNEN